MTNYYKRSETRRKSKRRKIFSKPRLSVFRSNKLIYCQIIDDRKGQTLVSSSEKELKTKLNTPIKRAFAVGELLATKAIKKGVKKVAFDKGVYKFHGRVKALAEGSRKGGLEF